MRFTKALEREVFSSLVNHPEDCITFPPEVYRNGTVYIYREGLAWRLHRYTYEKLTGQPAPMFMLRTCKTTGCMNFHHYEAARRPYRERKACPKGHRYTPKNTLPETTRDRCRQCRIERNARRRKGTGAHDGRCAKGHLLTETNVYRWVDDRGITHRRCRICLRNYQRDYRMEKR